MSRWLPFVALTLVACPDSPRREFGTDTDVDSDTDVGTDADSDSDSDSDSDTEGDTDPDSDSDNDSDSDSDTDSDTVGGVVADFLLEDVNPTSATYGEAVSPRDYLEKVSGWYFAHAT